MSALAPSCDFERAGRHSYRHSILGETATGVVEAVLSVTVFNNGPGPSLLLTGGCHGDEYEGPVALCKFLQSADWLQMRGRLIVIPNLNPAALAAGTRRSALDAKDLNRSFPGDPQGTITEAIAALVSRHIVPLVDAVFDLHAGGVTSFIVPSVMVHPLDDAGLMRRTLAAAQSFRAPATVVVEEFDTEGMFDTTVERAGKIFCCAELGSAGTLSVETIAIAEHGVRNVLIHFGMLGGTPSTPTWRGQRTTRLWETHRANSYVLAADSGLFEPFIELGDIVSSGEAVGQIHFPAEPGRVPVVLHAAREGHVFARQAPGRAVPGDWIAVIAGDRAPEDVDYD